eukprot:TRINITY_DN2243_c0_g3_i2.p1 TRINITY_DN2243_c0_g3~~TRINITY_DN2243_c0_g3_i2.p1  ORF type:complete len:274 (+),score=60.89 TRINITY_DN2243_c0_g3_i2:211-1032(+)
MALAAGRFYLSTYDQHTVVVVDAVSGARVTSYGTFKQQGWPAVGQSPQFCYPWGVAVDERRGLLYVVDQSNSRVVVVRLCDGVVEALWGSEGTGPHQLLYPRGLAYCPTTDLLYVSDNYNHCVKVLRGSDGQFVQVLGAGRGNGRTGMDLPLGIAVDSHHIYIADSDNHRVVVYSKQSGVFAFEMGRGEGSGNNQFKGPCDVSVDPEAGLVYVADYDNYRVCVYRSGDGSYVRHFQVLQGNAKAKPVCVLWDAAAGVLYVTTENSTTISAYEC